MKLSPPQIKTRLGNAAAELERIEEELRRLAALAPAQKAERLRALAERTRAQMLSVKIASEDLPETIEYRVPPKRESIAAAEAHERREARRG